MYEVLLNNKKYLECVNKIESIKFITDGKWDWDHGLGHYKRVSMYVKRILEQLNVNERTIELGMVAALLYDIGLKDSGANKTDHALKSSMIFREFLDDIVLTKEEELILESAIRDHSNGNHITSLVAFALVLADKLDITYHRTIHSSIQDALNREVQKIKKVDVIVNDTDLIIEYEVDGSLDFDIIRQWEKAIMIPRRMAQYLNKNCIFMMNHQIVEP